MSEFTKHAQSAQHQLVKNRHLEKFRKSKTSRADLDTNWRNNDSSVDSPNAEKLVKNLSNRPLSKSEVSVLSKGCNFAVVPETVSVAEFVTVTKLAIQQARLSQEILKQKICNTLCNTKLPQSNITKDERIALAELPRMIILWRIKVNV